jgi:uncharacterized RDD family membrane protein YckC
MYCPHCGVNNDRKEVECFICHKPLPSLDAPAASAPARSKADRRVPGQEHTLASVGDRMIALVFDRVVIAAILLLGGAWAADRWRNYTLPRFPWSLAALGGTIVIATFLYHFISETAFMTTIGKAAMGLHIGIENGRGRIGAIALRNILRIIDAIGVYFVGFLFATFTRRRQRVGDLVGGTLVLDWPIARAGRAAVMVLIVMIAAAAVWLARAVCPTCAGQVGLK